MIECTECYTPLDHDHLLEKGIATCPTCLTEFVNEDGQPMPRVELPLDEYLGG